VTLLERVKGADQAAWDQLVTLYGPLVYGWCRRAGLQAADAADVGQEVFKAVSRKIGAFERRPGQSFRGWLRVIARRKVIDWYRRRGPAWIGMGGDEGQRRMLEVATPEEEAADTASLCQRALDLISRECSERTWKAFARVALDGQCPVDVATEMGVTANTVYLAKSRILRRLRELLAGLEDDTLS
jgi:RNA polymerase sigma-70 factor (ECF subfamily)